MDTYEKFMEDLKKKFDLDLSGYKRPQMERRINTLMRTLGAHNYDGFIQLMLGDRKVFERFIDHLTINVSEFFRNASQWDVLQKSIIPQLLNQSANLKIWSAGCSTGEEPYTVAMILLENFKRSQYSIIATDFDDRVLQKAKDGYYHKKQAAGIPASYLAKYFTVQSEGYKASEELKRLITFKHHNLLRDPFPDQCDLIICRNVVIYFTEDTKSTLYKRFFNALKPNGMLFTGSTEQITQARDIGFVSPEIFFYKRPAK